jgi:acylphosphatase
VEVVAQGSSEQLDQYCELLKKGPSFCQVREVVVKAIDPSSQEAQFNSTQFEIRPDPELS